MVGQMVTHTHTRTKKHANIQYTHSHTQENHIVQVTQPFSVLLSKQQTDRQTTDS